MAVGRAGGVAAGVGGMNEAVESVVVGDDETLRLGRAPARPRCQDRQGGEGAPVPAAVPGEFVVYLGTDDVPDGLDPDLTALLLTWIEWVEVEVQGYDDLLEGLARLKGALMAAATPAVGEW